MRIYLSKSQGRWLAVVEIMDASGTIHSSWSSGASYGWRGLEYDTLRSIILERFSVTLPRVKELQFLKQTGSRKVYVYDNN